MDKKVAQLFGMMHHFPKGIIHAGAHACEEKDFYIQKFGCRVLWIDANQTLVDKHQSLPPGHKMVQGLLGKKSGEKRTWYLSDHNGISSTMYPPKRHIDCYEHIKFDQPVELETTTLPKLMKQHGLTFEDYNVLNMDLQGAELEVIQSLEGEMAFFDVIVAEMCMVELFGGAPVGERVRQEIEMHGFHHVATKLIDEWHCVTMLER